MVDEKVKRINTNTNYPTMHILRETFSIDTIQDTIKDKSASNV